MSVTDDQAGNGRTITFRVVRTPSGWQIFGVESLVNSTIYLSLDAALTQARSMADVLARHGHPARVIVDPDVVVD
ncbi:MAG TPA: hypothetical protein VN806_09330 [Caulobacteraceae bacterium]|nr:hypothetical protein [Caulobacteraceae bacterium]